MNYRLYSFVNNLYMNEKQWGIQTAHAVGDMAVNAYYKPESDRSKLFIEWARHHKTIIMCQGINVGNLETVADSYIDTAYDLGFPVATFYEDQQSLNNAITCAAFVLPETYYDCKGLSQLSGEALELALFIQGAKLA